jgi:3-dehydroquinate synthase
MISRSCQIKQYVVEKDPTEKGDRALLNLGHTIGHAIEKMKDFKLLHGECVALGCVAAAYISWQRGMIDEDEFFEIRDMNVGFGLPISFDGLDSESILMATKKDKKMVSGQIKFILLKKLGRAYIDQTVSDQEMLDAINYLNADVEK